MTLYQEPYTQCSECGCIYPPAMLRYRADGAAYCFDTAARGVGGVRACDNTVGADRRIQALGEDSRREHTTDERGDS